MAREHVFVAPLLEGIELDRFAQQRIGRDCGVGRNIEPGTPLRLDRDVPDG
jgi:hypothetical protein